MYCSSEGCNLFLISGFELRKNPSLSYRVRGGDSVLLAKDEISIQLLCKGIHDLMMCRSWSQSQKPQTGTEMLRC